MSVWSLSSLSNARNAVSTVQPGFKNEEQNVCFAGVTLSYETEDNKYINDAQPSHHGSQLQTQFSRPK